MIQIIETVRKVNISVFENENKIILNVSEIKNPVNINISEIGSKGLSAYQVALASGFNGTQTQWLDSLKSTTSNIDGGLIF